MKGCGGCLGWLAILALLSGSNGAPSLVLIAIALVVVSAAGRGLVHRRSRLDASSGGTLGPARQPRVAAIKVDATRETRSAPAWGRGHVQPAHRNARPGGVLATRRHAQARVSRGPAAVRAGTSNGLGARRARDPLPAQLRFSILQRDRFRCRYCGRPGSERGVVLHVDHVVPVAAGGATSKDNLLTACEECNLGKGTRMVISLGS